MTDTTGTHLIQLDYMYKWADINEMLKWDKVFKSGLSKLFKGCLPQNLLSPLLNTLSQMFLSF